MAHPMVNRLNTFHLVADMDAVAHSQLEKLAENSAGTDRHGRWICFRLQTKISKDMVAVVKELLSMGMSVRILEGDLIMAPTVDTDGSMNWGNTKKSRLSRATPVLKVKIPEPQATPPVAAPAEQPTEKVDWKPGPRLLAKKFF